MQFLEITNTNILLVNTSIGGSNVIIASSNTGYDANAGSLTSNAFSIILDTSEEFNRIVNALEVVSLNAVIYSSLLANISNQMVSSSQSLGSLGDLSALSNLSSLGNIVPFIQDIRDAMNAIRDSMSDIRNDIRVLKQRGENTQQGIVTRQYDDFESLSSKQQRAIIISALKSSETLSNVVSEINNPTQLPGGR